MDDSLSNLFDPKDIEKVYQIMGGKKYQNSEELLKDAREVILHFRDAFERLTKFITQQDKNIEDYKKLFEVFYLYFKETIPVLEKTLQLNEENKKTFDEIKKKISLYGIEQKIFTNVKTKTFH